jgi:hypothetical protein
MPMATNEADIRNAALATPEMIAAAWATWHSRHGGKLGPGPAFVEAINAALAIRALKSDPAPVPAPKPFTFADPARQREWEKQRREVK